MKKDIELKLNLDLQNRLKELPEVAIDFILSLSNNKTLRTQIAYTKDLKIYFNFLLNELKIVNKEDITELEIEDIKDITEKDIRLFLDYLNYYTVEYKTRSGKLVTQSYSNSREGKARKLATLHSFYKEITRKYPFIKDPTQHIDIKVYQKTDIKNYLTGEEIDKLVKVILEDLNINSERELKFHKRYKYRNATMILFLGYTGIRVSELVSLDIDDISIEDRSFIVTRKGGNQEKLYIPDEIIYTLSNYITMRKSILDVDTFNRNALFLSNRKQRISTRQVEYILDKYGKKAGFNNVTPHTFRRSFGMAFYNNSKDIQLTADILGHSTTETTRKFYAKPLEERKRLSLKNFKY